MSVCGFVCVRVCADVFGGVRGDLLRYLEVSLIVIVIIVLMMFFHLFELF